MLLTHSERGFTAQVEEAQLSDIFQLLPVQGLP